MEEIPESPWGTADLFTDKMARDPDFCRVIERGKSAETSPCKGVLQTYLASTQEVPWLNKGMNKRKTR